MAQDGKVCVSTPLDRGTADLLDGFCASIHRNRAEVIRGILYALLIDGKEEIFSEWRKVAGTRDRDAS